MHEIRQCQRFPIYVLLDCLRVLNLSLTPWPAVMYHFEKSALNDPK